MNFEESVYTIAEEETLEVCVVLLGSTEVNVTVILSAEEDSVPENVMANGNMQKYLI